MTKTTGFFPQICGFDQEKFIAFLRRFGGAKEIARALKVSPRTVENWISGVSTPRCGEFVRMIALWDVEFLCAVMSPPPPWAEDAKARAELAELERKSAALKSKLRAVLAD